MLRNREIQTMQCSDLSKDFGNSRDQRKIAGAEGKRKIKSWIKQTLPAAVLLKKSPITHAVVFIRLKMFPTFSISACFSNTSIFSHAYDSVYFNINFKFYNNLKIYHLKCYAAFKSVSLFFSV